jgi:hypothetical protein
MKTLCKRSIAVILTVMMVISLTVTALAAGSDQTFDRTTIGTEKLITGYTVSGKETSVLELVASFKATERVDGKFVITDYTFTGVDANAFNPDPQNTKVTEKTRKYLITVKELIIDEGITDIGENAFANLPLVQKITFKGDANIGKSAFANLPELQEINFSGKTILAENTFANCPKLKEVVFDNDATVGTDAFTGCNSLQKVTFKGDGTLETEAFSGSKALEEVVFEKDAFVGSYAFCACAALKKVVFNGNVQLQEGAMQNTPALKDVEFGDESDIAGYQYLAGSSYFDNNAVDFVMRDSTLICYTGNDEVVTIPENVTAIGAGAFEGNKNLRAVNITKFVDTLGDRAFMNCSNLEAVNFATFGDIENIGKDVFTGTKYYNDFDGDFFTIGTVLVKFRGEGENSVVTIPNTITAITDDCFDGCYKSLANDGYSWVVSSIFVPASVKQVGANSFTLGKMADGNDYIPRIYAYNGTDALEVLQNAGYNVIAAPALADVNNNGVIEPADARLALRMSVHLDYDRDPMYAHAADVNGDHQITAADARTILRLAIQLENYEPEELLYMPMTKQEILMYYAQATDNARRFNVGYTKTASNAVTGYDMCPAAYFNFYKTLATKGEANGTWTYAPNTADALNNFDVCTLMSDRNIVSATCILGEDGKYTIDIKFKDQPDNFSASGISKALPAKSRAFFASSFTGKSWWNGTKESNALTKFDLTYTNGSIHSVVVKKTNKIESAKLTIGYHFAVDGRVNGLAISSKLWKTGDATLDRLETVEYSKFIYNPITDDRQ